MKWCFYYPDINLSLWSDANIFFQSVLSLSFIHIQYLLHTENSNFYHFNSDIFTFTSFIPKVYSNTTVIFQHILGLQKILEIIYVYNEANISF